MEEQTEIKKNVNVTCYRKYDYENDNTEDVTKIFSTINSLKSKFHLKFSNHPDCGIIMLLFNRDNFAEFKKELDFSVSKYTSVTKYTCDTATAEKLKQQKDSFLRLHYDEGMLLFTSRTPLNVHKKLVKRIFKDSNVEFDKTNLVFTQNQGDNTQGNNTQGKSNDGFQVVTNKKYHKQNGPVKHTSSYGQSTQEPFTPRGQPSPRGQFTHRGQVPQRGRGGAVRTFSSVVENK
jgi:hypothetical protein